MFVFSLTMTTNGCNEKTPVVAGSRFEVLQLNKNEERYINGVGIVGTPQSLNSNCPLVMRLA